MKRVAALEGLNISDPKALTRLNSLMLAKVDEDLSSVNGLDASFANAIKAYMQAKVQRDHRLASDALGWLKGSSNLAISRKRQLGVRGGLSPLAALNFVKGLLCHPSSGWSEGIGLGY